MTCYYCGSENVKPLVANNGKVYLIECLDNKEGFCKRTTIPQIENCIVCDKEFEFLFDPGWNEHIICWPCQKQAMKEYFESPELKEAMKVELKKEMPDWWKSIPKESWGGAYIPVPFKIK